MLAECEVAPQVFQGVAERLTKFVEPFAKLLTQPAQREHAMEYLSGLVSDLERKNVESIAYRHDQDRRKLQHFIGCAEWDHRPLLMELARQVGAELGEDDGVIVFDPSAFPKQGKKSVGVARQWCGRLGKVDNCQVAVYMAYVSREDHALVNARLYLPKEWAQDRVRRKAAGVPKEVRFQTRHEQALEMLDEQGHLLPHAWIAGDDEMGRNAGFRRDLHESWRAIPAGGSLRHARPRPGSAAARIPRARRRPQTSLRTRRPVARRSSRRRLDADQRPRRRKRTVGSRGGRLPRQDQDQSARDEIRRDARGHSLVGRRGRDEVRLLFLERSLRNVGEGVRPRRAGRPSHRRSDQAQQERGGAVALRSSQLARLASPSGALAHGHLVLGA